MSVDWQPTPKDIVSTTCSGVGKGKTVTSIHNCQIYAFPIARSLILCLHKGFAFGLDPEAAASKVIWLIETMSSLAEEVIPQAPRPGE